MMINSVYPYELPKALQDPQDYWVGTLNVYGPQLKITEGPNPEAVIRAFAFNELIALAFVSRTADMDEDDPSIDEGTIEVEVIQIISDEDESIDWLNFLGQAVNVVGRSVLSAGNYIWFWEYDGHGGGGADFAVGQ